MMKKDTERTRVARAHNSRVKKSLVVRTSTSLAKKDHVVRASTPAPVVLKEKKPVAPLVEPQAPTAVDQLLHETRKRLLSS